MYLNARRCCPVTGGNFQDSEEGQEWVRGRSYLHKKIPRQRSSLSQWHKQLGTGSVCSTICTMPSWWGAGQGGTTSSKCENQKVKTARGFKFWKYRASLSFGRWRGCSTEPLPCCTPRSQDSNSCVLGYLCARALNSHKAEPHPDSGQAVWGNRAPQACTRAVTNNCLKMNLKHYLLYATIFFLLRSHYLLLQKSKWFSEEEAAGKSLWTTPVWRGECRCRLCQLQVPCANTSDQR